MYRVLILASSLSALSSFAGLQTILCSDANHSIRLEEGIDDYFLDITETSYQGTLAYAFTKKTESTKYLINVRIPKVIGGEFGAPRPNCLSAEDRPLLFSCWNGTLKEKAKITNTATQETKEIPLSYFQTQTHQLQREFIDIAGKVQKEDTVRLSVQTYVVASEYAKVDLDFARAACKTGDTESPARP